MKGFVDDYAKHVDVNTFDFLNVKNNISKVCEYPSFKFGHLTHRQTSLIQ